MQIIRDALSIAQLKTMSEKLFPPLVKAVVDIEKEIMAVDLNMHADAQCALLQDGSHMDNLWGITLHPDKLKTGEWIEFGSLINYRPIVDNRSRFVEDPIIRKKIINVIAKLVQM